MSDEKVILVAFVVDAESEAEAEDYLREVVLPADYPAGLEGWWVAEDGRAEGSDNDSAVFVPKGRQAEAYDILRKAFKDNADYQAWTQYEFDGFDEVPDDRVDETWCALCGQKFVWCAEHERPVSKCRQLATEDYGQPAFDNCQWITEHPLT